MKISVKMTLFATAAMVGILGVFLISITSLGKLDKIFAYIGDTHVRNAELANKVLDHVNELAKQSAMMCFDTIDIAHRMALNAESVKGIGETMDTLKANVNAEEMNVFLQQSYDALNELMPIIAEFTDAIHNNELSKARELRRTTLDVSIKKTFGVIMQMVDFATAQTYNAAYVTSEEESSFASNTIIVMSIVIFIVVGIVAFVIVMGITKPLQRAVDAANDVSRGNLKVDLSTNANDEIGTLMHSLEVMVKSINKLITDIDTLSSAAIDGDFKYRADASRHHGDFRAIMEGVNQLVEVFVEPLEATSEFLQGVAMGSDNLQKITMEYQGEFNVIKNSVNRVHDILFTVLGGIVGAAEEAEKGNLDVKADSSKVQGSWAVLMNGLNKIITAANTIITDAGGVLSSMATGDLTPRITKDYPGKFGAMKDNINHLGESLTDLISHLTEAIHTTAASSAQILATSETIATAIQEQASQAAEVASAVEEMSKTVTDNAHNATKTADVAKKSGEVANNGGKVVQHTVNKMREISEVVKSSAENIAKLGESSKKIGEIISVIDDIADQTNLLSLNAAIEAARAGEQGRGFAVVADSVGKLSINTTSATKEIEKMIKGIQMETYAAVKAMEKGTAEVQSGIELADNAGNSIQSILSGINELLNMIEQIATANGELSTTSEDISKSVSSISKVTAESAKNVEDVAHTVNELAKMTETLTSLVSQFKIDSSDNSHSSISVNATESVTTTTTGNSRYLN